MTPATDTPPDQPERPDWAGCLCKPPDEGYPWKPADQSYATCSRCLDRCREIMRDVEKRYRLLDPTPGASGEAGGRGAPGFHSRSPASEHVITFTDPRSSQTAKVWLDRAGRVCCEDERPPVSVRGELDILAWDVAEQLEHAGPDERADVGDLLRWLDARLDQVTRDAGLTEQVMRTVRALQSALKPVTGEPRPKYIGHCAVVLDELDDEGIPVVCGTRLYAPPRGEIVFCRGCETRWTRDDWEKLGEALLAAA